MEKCFAGKLACGVRKANALHTSSELFAFAKSFVCWVEVSKKKNPLGSLFLEAPPRILAMRFYCYPLVLFCFTCYLSHSLCSWLVAFAKLTHCSAERTFFAWAKNRSFAGWRYPKKREPKGFAFFWRHHPESNWGWKFCRLLPYRLAMVP